MGRPIGVDLFAGAGGMSLGFEQAGFDVAAAVEIDPVHCAVHKFNFPQTAVIPRSGERLTGREIRLAAGLGTRTVDCVFGGAPCQGFSLIGHRVLDDPRNRLALEFVRIVSELDARTFVFENVKGLTVGHHKQVLNELVAAFDEKGYQVRLPWRVLNAGNFGTPQSRERLILFGAKKGETLPDYPVPMTAIAGRRANPDLESGPNCADALADLPDAEMFEELTNRDVVKPRRLGKPSAYAAEMRCMTNEAWHFAHPRQWDPSILTSSARTDHTNISRRRFSETAEGEIEPISRLFKLPSIGVSNTLRAGTDGARGAFTSPRPIHFKFDRCITVREMARLHGFPDWFRFNATKWHGARQIGNAVPPPLARAVASQVVAALGFVPSRPSEAIALGNPALLEMDVTNASAHFGIEPPKSGRDRKSASKSISKQNAFLPAWPMVKSNRYQALISKIFFDGYQPGIAAFEFERMALEHGAESLGIKLPKNLGDVIYSVRFRTALPDDILATQPPGMEWIIEGAGRAAYRFKLVRVNRVVPRADLVRVSIPDATPEIIRAYALDDEQALLAIVRYNRLIDTFLGLTTYSLQNHLRTTVKGIGQIEIDELYIGLDKRGCHYVIPVQAKGGKDQIGIVQTTQDIRFVEQKFPGLTCRAIAAQFMEDQVIALFELTLEDDEIRVVEERHYRLVPARDLDRQAIRTYR